MKITIVMFCLVGAVYANPIHIHNVILELSELESLNMTQTQKLYSSSSQSSDQSDTSELESSESLESTSESSESHSSESKSQSHEDKTVSHTDGDTRDNSEGSEENVRKNWIKVFAVQVVSAEISSSSEVRGQLENPTNPGAEKQSTRLSTAFTEIHSQPSETAQSKTAVAVVEGLLRASFDPLKETSASINIDSFAVTSNDSTSRESSESKDNSETRDHSSTSESKDSDTSESNASDTSESKESDTSESKESNSSESKESNSSESKESNSSESKESNESNSSESNTSESDEKQPKQATVCQNGVNSTACNSEEDYFFQDIGDDAPPMEHLLMSEEEHRELSLR